MNNIWNPFNDALPQKYKEVVNEVSGISSDSRQIKEKTLFVAIKGKSFDGHNYIQEVINKGVQIIVVDENAVLENIPENVQIIKSTETRLSYAYLCGEYYKPVPEKILTVTGTNGKTSTVEFCRQILSNGNIKSASLGTLGTIVDDKKFTSSKLAEVVNNDLTTMDAKLLGQTLNELAKDKVSVAIVEASSHGISQFRLDGIKPISAGLTKITSDHLDYHGTWENYRDAKIKLFSRLISENSWAILPKEDVNAETIRTICKKRKINIINYGYKNSGHDNPEILCFGSKETLTGTIYKFKLHDTAFQVELPVWGGFQSENLMTAMGLALTVGLSDSSIINSIKHCRSSEGRMQLIAYHNQGGRIFVDFAHSPDALLKVLTVALNSLKGMLWLVFGCGGDRDKKKRPIMGSIAQRFANRVFVTDDNPRNEDPALIRKNILSGTNNDENKLGIKICEIPERESAIAKSIKSMSFSDTLIIAGKGHEKYQIIGNESQLFDDCLIASKYAKITGWNTSPYTKVVEL